MRINALLPDHFTHACGEPILKPHQINSTGEGTYVDLRFVFAQLPFYGFLSVYSEYREKGISAQITRFDGNMILCRIRENRELANFIWIFRH